ncbi:hypothetical protein EYF80_013309 [Liparis tanakae]|uniref:Uncharacterized protein n=1 Tax=Liparis tanakae TaxID=230148 RepID=A0A4Z2IG92_9TELE|nr:hypothetical protein EYF80_013309 [Liparis tanakae]
MLLITLLWSFMQSCIALCPPTLRLLDRQAQYNYIMVTPSPNKVTSEGAEVACLTTTAKRTACSTPNFQIHRHKLPLKAALSINRTEQVTVFAGVYFPPDVKVIVYPGFTSNVDLELTACFFRN